MTPFVLRIPDDLKQRLEAEAKGKYISLNTLILQVLEEHADRQESKERTA